MLLIILLLFMAQSLSASKLSKRIAIVGAGMGGSSAAYYIKKYIPDAKVTVFEKNDYVGGRVHHVKINGKLREVGADVYHESNLLYAGFVKEFGLKPLQVSFGKAGVWNGKDWAFKENDWTLVNIFNAFLKYGFSPFYLEGYCNEYTPKWQSQYNENQHDWTSIEEFLEHYGLKEIRKHSTYDYLFNVKKMNEDFINDFIHGFTKVIYQQSPRTLNALSGLVSLVATSNAHQLHNVEGGNNKVAQNLIKKSKAHLRTNTEVTSIERIEENNNYIIKIKDNTTEEYDSVIFAIPWETANIQLKNMRYNVNVGRVYVHMFVTLIHGKCNPAYWGLNEVTEIPSTVFVNSESTAPFTSFDVEFHIDGTQTAKFFSPKNLTDEELGKMFFSINEKVIVEWFPYPEMPADSIFPPFVVDQDFFYLNAFESVFSTMESSLLAGRNAANLLHKTSSEDQRVHYKPEL